MSVALVIGGQTCALPICRAKPFTPVRVERSRDTHRYGASSRGISTSLDANGLWIFDMTDLFSKFDPLIQQREDLLATGVTDPYNLVMERVLSPTVAICNGRETILLGTYNYMGMTFDEDVIAVGKDALDKFGSGNTGRRTDE